MRAGQDFVTTLTLRSFVSEGLVESVEVVIIMEANETKKAGSKTLPALVIVKVQAQNPRVSLLLFLLTVAGSPA